LKIPLISYIAGASQAFPILASLRYGRRLPTARRWILVWAAVLLLADVIGFWYSLHHTRNLWLAYFTGPLELSAGLMALSYWQLSSRARFLFRAAIPFFVLTSAVLAVLIEDTDSYSLITGPFESLILFTASLATLLACAWRLEGSLARQDWFWVGVGLALLYGSNAGFDPIARALVRPDLSTLVTIHKMEAWIDLAASLLIAGGILCPIPPLRASSGPTSLASSPSPSSSPHSAPPW
jgi:hypothetical protein